MLISTSFPPSILPLSVILLFTVKLRFASDFGFLKPKLDAIDSDFTVKSLLESKFTTKFLDEYNCEFESNDNKLLFVTVKLSLFLGIATKPDA